MELHNCRYIYLFLLKYFHNPQVRNTYAWTKRIDLIMSFIFLNTLLEYKEDKQTQKDICWSTKREDRGGGGACKRKLRIFNSQFNLDIFLKI